MKLIAAGLFGLAVLVAGIGIAATGTVDCEKIAAYRAEAAANHDPGYYFYAVDRLFC